ncbi:hypothetical protein [Pseudobutyrivibrio sp.]|uniref:hypothetical protein n=1 Tax=Pseudobutyrivibrio sp. TaxID=2014367 RepID=UPI003867133F
MKEKIRVSEIEELALLLDNELNISEGIDALNQYVNSGCFANWKCPKEHSCNEKISVIYRRKHKCFYCSGRLIWSGENDLQTLYPELAKEFDIECNGVEPKNVEVPNAFLEFYRKVQ